MKKILLLILIVFLSGCSRNNYEELNMFYMDTYIGIKIYNISNEKKEIVFDEIDNIFREYHQLCDRYNNYDDIVNIYYLNNILENNEPIAINNKLEEILLYGIEAYDLTFGKVNITIGNAVDLWDSYKENKSGIPNLEELKNLKSTSIEDIKIKNDQFIKFNDVKIDLGAICKGYVTEIVANKIEEYGYNKYLINAGGNIKVGDHYSNKKYKIGLEDPTEKLLVYKILNANNISVVTSGGYERFYIYENNRYHHILDPMTFYPTNYSLSTSVITKDSALGDILSTYLFLIPIEDGIKYINSLDGVEAVWFDLDNNIYLSNGVYKYE